MNCKAIIHEYLEKHPDHKKVDMLAELVFEELHDLYHEDKEEFHERLKEIHEHFDGHHYNEHLAKHDVSQLFHRDGHGEMRHGEIWSSDHIKEKIARHGLKIPHTYNHWDVYVAFNVNYHDKCNLFKRWFPQDFELKIMEDAICFYFADENHEENIIWEHMK